MDLSSAQSQVALEYLDGQAPLLFFLLDVDGMVLSANRYSRELLGPSVLGLNFGELVVDFQKSFRVKDYIHMNAAHHLLSISIPDGLPKSFFFTFRLVNDAILVFGKSDAEESDLLRAALLNANQELNNLTRTLHKKNAQLAHLNTIKNQFLGMAAHDLRKPLSVILSYTEFLLDETREVLNLEHTSFLERIDDSATFMKRLVDDFLDVSAIEAGHFHLNIARVNPAEILARSLVLARIQAAKKGVELAVTAAPELSEIPLDADKIEQAMSNLLGNAIEHSPPGKCVSVELKEAKEEIVFAVRNQGPGISQEAMKKLFVPFAKTGSIKTGGEKSTGLGLTITRKIIDAHHGKIVAESEEGTGTTFTIILTKRNDNG